MLVYAYVCVLTVMILTDTKLTNLERIEKTHIGQYHSDYRNSLW